MKQTKFLCYVVFISSCFLCTNCSQQNSPRKENLATDVREQDIISSMGIYTYYAQQDTMRLFTPYTYMMNKYLDLAIGYINGDWYNINLSMSITEKQAVIDAYAINNAYLEDEYLCNSDFDEFFNTLYDSLIVELNSFPIIQSRIAESIEISGIDSVDMNYADMIVALGGTSYDKLKLLAYAENHQLMPHESFDMDIFIAEQGCTCDCNPVYAPSREHSRPHRLNQNTLHLLWLDDIRYRNESNSCTNIYDLRNAMNEWEAASNNAIHFREISDNGWNRFTWAIGCNYHVRLSSATDPNVGGSSTVGCVPWAFIRIKPYANKSTCLHELGHTLGLHHEQCRPDRDCYIDIDMSNVIHNYEHDFDKEWCISVDMFGDFDFNSIMMYDSYAFSKNGLPTMTKKDGSTFDAYPEHLSNNDILYIQYLYHE